MICRHCIICHSGTLRMIRFEEKYMRNLKKWYLDQPQPPSEDDDDAPNVFPQKTAYIEIAPLEGTDDPSVKSAPLKSPNDIFVVPGFVIPSKPPV